MYDLDSRSAELSSEHFDEGALYHGFVDVTIVRSDAVAPQPVGVTFEASIVAGDNRHGEAVASAEVPVDTTEHLGTLSTAAEVTVEEPAGDAAQETEPKPPAAAAGDGGGVEPPTDETPPGPAEPGEGDDQDPEQSGLSPIENPESPAEAEEVETGQPQVPVLYRASQLAEKFDLSPNGISRLRPKMFALVLGDRTYRFPEEYANAFSEFLDQMASLPVDERPSEFQRAHHMTDVTPGPMAAKYFATTDRASEVIESVQARFEAALRGIASLGGEMVGAEEFAALVGVNEQTIDAWRRTGLEVLSPGWHQPRVISLHALRRFCRWQDPRPTPEDQE